MEQFSGLSPVVLLGGLSAEVLISLKSGKAVARALEELGFSVQTFDPVDCPLKEYDWPDGAIAVNLLHGTYGEDGTVQAELEELGIPYTGSGPQASQQAFHKSIAKRLFLEAGLPTPDFACFNFAEGFQNISAAAAKLGYPLVVKPEAQGSSMGVSIVHSDSQLLPALRLVSTFEDQVLLEKYIEGEEWTVPILNREILPAIRISPEQSFFDFQAKYQDQQTSYEVISANDSKTACAVSEIGLAACAALKTSGICRADFIVDQSGQPWLLEVNTIPGMTENSLVPKSARQHGLEMPELCRRILLSAFSNQTNQ